MDPILIAIGAVVIVVLLVGAFFLKNRSKKPASIFPPTTLNTEQPITSTDVQNQTIPNAQPIVQPQMPSSQPTPSTQNTGFSADLLALAQKYVEQQDFDGAINTLKFAIQQNPQRSDLRLFLLNVYALVKDYDSFNENLQPLLALNDPMASLQANNLKTLLDEEIAATNAIKNKVTQPIQEENEALDFDFPVETPVQQTTHTQQPTPQAIPTQLQQPNLQQPENITPVVRPAVTPKTTISTNDNISFGTNFGQTSISQPTFTLPKTQQPVQPTQPAINTTKAEPEIDFLDFDFDTPTTNQTQPIHQATSVPAVSIDDSFPAFTLEDDKPTISKTEIVQPEPKLDFTETTDFNFSVEPPKPQQPEASKPADSIDFDFDFDVSFDKPQEKTPSVQPSTFDKTPRNFEQEFIFDDAIDFSETSKTTPKTTISESLFDDDTFSFDALELDNTSDKNTQQTISQPTNVNIVKPNLDVEPTLQLEPNIENTFNQQNSNIPNATAPASFNDSQDLSAALAMVKDLDSVQVTVELAQKYIALGEYDSAKRLLKEIQYANPSQQQIIQQLLTKIS